MIFLTKVVKAFVVYTIKREKTLLIFVGNHDKKALIKSIKFTIKTTQRITPKIIIIVWYKLYDSEKMSKNNFIYPT